MAIVSSQGQLTIASAAPLQPQLSTVSTSGPFFDGYRRSYGQIYKTQPAVRTVIEFFSRNIAQLGLHGFLRVGETDRQRLAPQHLLSRLIKTPNFATTRYRFIDNTVQDIGTYANGYWWKQRFNGTLSGLIRLPAGEVSVAGSLLPSYYVWTPANGLEPKRIPREDLVHFRMFDPTNPSLGFPPIETLRLILAEEAAAGAYRRAFWQNGARFEHVITRPHGVPKWEPNDRQNFRKEWQEFAGKRAGSTPILEDGMDIKPMSQNFRDSEYINARKLTREEVAAAYHVPLPMVGILEHATFSNIREQHKQLYQDCLGPWLTMLEEELELQLLPEFEDLDPDTFYLEFNIAEKMKGSFEEQASSLTQAVGRPYMTANEARARLNLPKHLNPTADDLADVAPGQGQAFGGDRQATDTDAVAAVLRHHAARQTARIQKDPVSDRSATFHRARHRWAAELEADLNPFLGVVRATEAARYVTDETHTLLARGLQPWSGERIDALMAQLTDRGYIRG